MSSSSDAISPSLAASNSGRKEPSTIFLIAGAVLLAISTILLFVTGSEADPARNFSGWIVGVSFWVSIIIGMLFITMIWYLFDSGWSIVMRRQVEHAFAATPWLLVCFLPIIALVVLDPGSAKVAWTWLGHAKMSPGGHGSVEQDVLYQAKSGYLNYGALLIRFFGVFAVWIVLTQCFRKWSLKMDETGDHKYVHWARKLSAAGIPLCAAATTIAAIDWFKSMNYHWFSTMYGVWFFAASMRAGLAAIVLAMFWQSRRDGGLKGILKPAHAYLMGCIMLAFTIFWAYISFSQFFLIYSANIPEETFWYNMRELTEEGMKNSWFVISRLLIYGYFFVPFLWLLFYTNKFGWRIIAAASYILVFHLIDLYWNILPQELVGEHHEIFTRGFSIMPVDILTWLGTGCIFLWAYLKSSNQYRPIPIRDPRILESLNPNE
ncbi:MAG: hypothetical protein E1N59_3266 [Puniceicoccaceae bacterium 5H]|nr:MAG: hypothetical protein E1N59_3266 [Puniceicoccaceae bacterium 5H]